MPKKDIQVTDAELSILNVLWDHGPAPIREITARLYKKPTTAKYATVQKLLERLEAKRCVTRDRSQAAHVFAAKISSADLIGGMLQQAADKLYQGSMTPLLVQLVESHVLTAEDKEMLRKLLKEK